MIVLGQEFPGWGVAIGCALAVGVATLLMRLILPESVLWLDVVGGAVAGMALVRWLTDATWKQAGIVIGIYLALGFLVGLLL